MKIRWWKDLGWITKNIYPAVWMEHHHVIVNVEIRVVGVFVLSCD